MPTLSVRQLLLENFDFFSFPVFLYFPDFCGDFSMFFWDFPDFSLLSWPMKQTGEVPEGVSDTIRTFP